MTKKQQRDWARSTVGARLQWAMERVGVGQRELAAATGGEMSAAHVNRMLHNESRTYGMAAAFLSLARVLGVSPGWLAFGEGMPRMRREPYPNRAAAADLCREIGVDEEAIRQVLDEIVPSGPDLPVLVWADEIRARASKLSALRQAKST